MPDKSAAALLKLFKPGGPLEGYPLRRINAQQLRNEKPIALNALQGIEAELQQSLAQGYDKLLMKIFAELSLSSSEDDTVLPDLIGPWVYLALHFPETIINNNQADLEKLVGALKDKYRALGKKEFSEFIAKNEDITKFINQKLEEIHAANSKQQSSSSLIVSALSLASHSKADDEEKIIRAGTSPLAVKRAFIVDPQKSASNAADDEEKIIHAGTSPLAVKRVLIVDPQKSASDANAETTLHTETTKPPVATTQETSPNTNTVDPTIIKPTATALGSGTAHGKADPLIDPKEKATPGSDDSSDELSSLQALVELTRFHKKLSFLSIHSEFSFDKRRLQRTINSYQQLSTQACQLLPDNKEIQINQAEANELHRALSLNAPESIYYFGESFQFVANNEAAIAEAIRTISEAKGVAGNSNPEKLSGSFSTNQGQARVTQLNLGDEKTAETTAIVERYRQNSDGTKTFISESYLDKELIDKDKLKDWACSVLNSFFTAAPPGTEKVKFEDGYTPRQLAALISYCAFMGIKYEVGELQQLRIQAIGNRFMGPPEVQQQLANYQAVALTDELRGIAHQGRPISNWKEWATSEENTDFNSATWQTWLDLPATQKKHPQLLPFGIDHYTKLKEKVLVSYPGLFPVTRSENSFTTSFIDDATMTPTKEHDQPTHSHARSSVFHVTQSTKGLPESTTAPTENPSPNAPSFTPKT